MDLLVNHELIILEEVYQEMHEKYVETNESVYSIVKMLLQMKIDELRLLARK